MNNPLLHLSPVSSVTFFTKSIMGVRAATGSTPYLILLLTSVYGAVADNKVVNDTQCGCYVTNGTNSDFFSDHRFYDFRSLSQHVGSGAPAVPSASADDASKAPLTSSYFNSSAFTDDWSIMTWNNSASVGGDAAVLMANSPTNLFIEKNNDNNADSDTFLTMRTARNRDFQSASEIESNSDRFKFLSVRMLARTTGASGACTAIFTYRSAQNYADVQEADIEILTKDPSSRIQYTNQPSFVKVGNDSQSIAGSNVNVSVPVPWTDWAVHRLDWTPRTTTWYVNDQQVASISFQTPRDASRVNLNSWSDGGDWTGLMEVGKEARMQIKWIEMVFNQTSSGNSKMRARSRAGDGGRGTSSSASGGYTGSTSTAGLSSDGKSCKTVCSIDEDNARGLVTIVADGGAGALTLSGWIPIVVTLATLVATVF